MTASLLFRGVSVFFPVVMICVVLSLVFERGRLGVLFWIACATFVVQTLAIITALWLECRRLIRENARLKRQVWLLQHADAGECISVGGLVARMRDEE